MYYIYSQVLAVVSAEFLAASSKGKFVNERLKAARSHVVARVARVHDRGDRLRSEMEKSGLGWRHARCSSNVVAIVAQRRPFLSARSRSLVESGEVRVVARKEVSALQETSGVRRRAARRGLARKACSYVKSARPPLTGASDPLRGCPPTRPRAASQRRALPVSARS